MLVDTRPKLSHYLSKALVQSRIQTSFLSKPFITASDLLFLEAMAFEKCGIIGTLCQQAKIPFIRVLSVAEGCEKEGIIASENMSKDYILPFIETFNILDLIFQHSRSKTKFKGDFSDFIAKHGKERLPVDKAAVSVSVWANLGGYVGIEYPDFIERCLQCTYGKSKDLGFTAEQAQIIEAGVGSSPYSVQEVQHQVIDIFSEFCKEFYLKEVKEFSFIQ